MSRTYMSVHAASCTGQKDGNHCVLVRVIPLILAAHGCLPKALRRSFPRFNAKHSLKGILAQGGTCAFTPWDPGACRTFASAHRVFLLVHRYQTKMDQLGCIVHLVEWLEAFSCRPHL